MRIIFLDIDGVLATNSTYGKGMNNKWNSYMFDPKCVAVLNFILQETGAEIILSSDWRLTYSLQEMREIFAHNYVLKGPIGFTQDSYGYSEINLVGRADEIKMWLDLHSPNRDIKWVAIDYIDMSEKLAGNFVHCPNENDGIKGPKIKEKILEILL